MRTGQWNTYLHSAAVMRMAVIASMVAGSVIAFPVIMTVAGIIAIVPVVPVMMIIRALIIPTMIAMVPATMITLRICKVYAGYNKK